MSEKPNKRSRHTEGSESPEEAIARMFGELEGRLDVARSEAQRYREVLEQISQSDRRGPYYHRGAAIARQALTEHPDYVVTERDDKGRPTSMVVRVPKSEHPDSGQERCPTCGSSTPELAEWQEIDGELVTDAQRLCPDPFHSPDSGGSDE